MLSDRAAEVDAKRATLSKRARALRILTIDIETKPMTVYSWGLFKQYHSIDQIVDHGGTICFAAKWFGEKDTLFHSEREGREDMLRRAWELLTEADVVITYNGGRFDIPRLNQEFMLLGWGPPAPFKHVDLFRINARRFQLPSRKLDYLAQQSGVGSKVKHAGFQLWIDCMAGDDTAWALMEKYNRGDVTLTEKVYLRLLPWMDAQVHIGQMISDGKNGYLCPNCGSSKITKHGKPVRAFVRAYSLYRCGNCDSWMRDTMLTGNHVFTRPVK